MYEVELHRNAVKSLDRIQEPDYSRIISALSALEKNPRPKGVEKIRGTELWRVRKGDYRLVYLDVVRIGHRRDIYRGI